MKISNNILQEDAFDKLAKSLNLQQFQPQEDAFDKLAKSQQKEKEYSVFISAEDSIPARHNNPGNLIYVGQEGATKGEARADGTHWAKFETPKAGYEALKRDIELKISGKSKTGLTGESTVREFVEKFASEDPEKTQKYLDDLYEFEKITPDQKLKELDLDVFTRGVAKKESGTILIEPEEPKLSFQKMQELNEFEDLSKKYTISDATKSAVNQAGLNPKTAEFFDRFWENPRPKNPKTYKTDLIESKLNAFGNLFPELKEEADDLKSRLKWDNADDIKEELSRLEGVVMGTRTVGGAEVAAMTRIAGAQKALEGASIPEVVAPHKNWYEYKKTVIDNPAYRSTERLIENTEYLNEVLQLEEDREGTMLSRWFKGVTGEEGVKKLLMPFELPNILKDNAYVAKLAEKSQRMLKDGEDVELSADEERTLMALQDNIEANFAYDPQRYTAYNWGAALGQNIGFLLEFGLTSGIRKATTAGLERYLAKNILGKSATAIQGFKNIGAFESGLAKLAGVGVQAVYMPSMWQNMALDVSNGKPKGQAFMGSWYNMAGETFSESLFMGKLNNLASNPGLYHKTLNQIGSALAGKRGIRGIVKGLGEEYLEEKISEIWNAGEKKNLKEFLTEFTSLKSNVFTLGAVASMTGILGSPMIASDAGSYLMNKIALNDIKQTLDKGLLSDINLILDDKNVTVGDAYSAIFNLINTKVRDNKIKGDIASEVAKAIKYATLKTRNNVIKQFAGGLFDKYRDAEYFIRNMLLLSKEKELADKLRAKGIKVPENNDVRGLLNEEVLLKGEKDLTEEEKAFVDNFYTTLDEFRKEKGLEIFIDKIDESIRQRDEAELKVLQAQKELDELTKTQKELDVDIDVLEKKKERTESEDAKLEKLKTLKAEGKKKFTDLENILKENEKKLTDKKSFLSEYEEVEGEQVSEKFPKSETAPEGKFPKKETLQPKNIKDLEEVSRRIFGEKDEKRVKASAVVMDILIGNMAKRAGVSKAEMYKKFDFTKISSEELSKEEGVQLQEGLTYKGASVVRNGRNIIYAMTSPDVSTPMHEMAHAFEPFLATEERDAILAFAGEKEWTAKVSETFAKGFERYLAEGVAPNSKLKEIFENFKNWLLDIYRGITKSEIDIELNQPMRDIYDRMLAEDVELKEKIEVREAEKPKGEVVQKAGEKRKTEVELKKKGVQDAEKVTPKVAEVSKAEEAERQKERPLRVRDNEKARLEAEKEKEVRQERAETVENIGNNFESLFNYLGKNDLIPKDSNLPTLKFQTVESFQSLKEKTKLYKKAFGETTAKALRANMPIAFDYEKQLIEWIKEKIPVKSNMPFIVKNIGHILEKEFLDDLKTENKGKDKNVYRDPYSLLKEIGYEFTPTPTGTDILKFRMYYPKEGENGVSVICTYNDPYGRAQRNFVSFIVKDDALTTVEAEKLTQKNLNDSWKKYLESQGRKNTDGTYNLQGLKNHREDPFSTSILSIQISKDGGYIRIISRYNHTIHSGNVNPDVTYGGNLDKIANGLTDSLSRYFNVNLSKKQRDELPDGIIKDNQGRYFNYSEEENGIYYGSEFYIRDGTSHLVDINSERIIDGFIINNKGKIKNIINSTTDFIFGDNDKISKVIFLKGNKISITTNLGEVVFTHNNGQILSIEKINENIRRFVLYRLYEANYLDGNIILEYISYGNKYIHLFWANDIVEINGNADFRGSQITSLGSLQSIGGYADFEGSQITSLGSLQSIGGYAYFEGSQITSLGSLQSIEGYAYFEGSQITSLGSLQSIGEYADFRGSQITSLGSLQSIGGNAYFEGSQITSLGSLQSIGGYAYFEGSQITSLGSLQSIGGNAYFEDNIKDLGELKGVGESIYVDSNIIPGKNQIGKITKNDKIVPAHHLFSSILADSMEIRLLATKIHKEVNDRIKKELKKGEKVAGLSKESQLLFQSVWHGSPHEYNKEILVRDTKGNLKYLEGTKTDMPDVPVEYEVVGYFPNGRMKTEKIGTGEGAQAYGWGLYFTDRKRIAEGYAKMRKSIEYDLKELISEEEADKLLKKYPENVYLKDILSREYSTNIERTIDFFNGLIKSYNRLKELSKFKINRPNIEKNELKDIKGSLVSRVGETYAKIPTNEAIKNLKIAVSTLEKYKPKISRNLYKVKLHGDRSLDEFNYLRWDKKVTKSQITQIIDQLKKENKIKGAVPFEYYGKEKQYLNSILNNNGNFVYEFLTNVRGIRSAKEASLFLLRAGIDGIKYPTEMTRKGTHEDSFNYVIFDENIAEIEDHIKFQTVSEPVIPADVLKKANDSFLMARAESKLSEADAAVEAVKVLERSDWYKKLSKQQQEQAKVKFSEITERWTTRPTERKTREKTPLEASQEEIKLKGKEALIKRIQIEKQAIRDAVGAIKGLFEMFKEAQSKDFITYGQFISIIRRLSEAKDDKKLMAVYDYAENVIAGAEYKDNYSQARTFLKKIAKKKIRNKFGTASGLAQRLSKLDISLLTPEELKRFNEIAKQVGVEKKTPDVRPLPQLVAFLEMVEEEHRENIKEPKKYSIEDVGKEITELQKLVGKGFSNRAEVMAAQRKLNRIRKIAEQLLQENEETKVLTSSQVEQLQGALGQIKEEKFEGGKLEEEIQKERDRYYESIIGHVKTLGDKIKKYVKTLPVEMQKQIYRVLSVTRQDLDNLKLADIESLDRILYNLSEGYLTPTIADIEILIGRGRLKETVTKFFEVINKSKQWQRRIEKHKNDYDFQRWLVNEMRSIKPHRLDTWFGNYNRDFTIGSLWNYMGRGISMESKTIKMHDETLRKAYDAIRRKFSKGIRKEIIAGTTNKQEVKRTMQWIGFLLTEKSYRGMPNYIEEMADENSASLLHFNYIINAESNFGAQNNKKRFPEEVTLYKEFMDYLRANNATKTIGGIEVADVEKAEQLLRKTKEVANYIDTVNGILAEMRGMAEWSTYMNGRSFIPVDPYFPFVSMQSGKPLSLDEARDMLMQPILNPKMAAGSTYERMNKLHYINTNPTEVMKRYIKEISRNYNVHGEIRKVMGAVMEAGREAEKEGLNKGYMNNITRAIISTMRYSLDRHYHLNDFKMERDTLWNKFMTGLKKGMLATIHRVMPEFTSNVIRATISTWDMPITDWVELRKYKDVYSNLIEDYIGERYMSRWGEEIRRDIWSNKYLKFAEDTANWIITFSDTSVGRVLFVNAFKTNFKKVTGKDFDIEKYRDDFQYRIDNERAVETSAVKGVRKVEELFNDKAPLSTPTLTRFMGGLWKAKPTKKITQFVDFLQSFNRNEVQQIIDSVRRYRYSTELGDRALARRDIAAIISSNATYNILRAAFGVLINTALASITGAPEDKWTKKEREKLLTWKNLWDEFASATASIAFGGSTNIYLFAYKWLDYMIPNTILLDKEQRENIREYMADQFYVRHIEKWGTSRSAAISMTLVPSAAPSDIFNWIDDISIMISAIDEGEFDQKTKTALIEFWLLGIKYTAINPITPTAQKFFNRYKSSMRKKEKDGKPKTDVEELREIRDALNSGGWDEVDQQIDDLRKIRDNLND